MSDKATAVRVPRETVNDETVLLVAWRVKDGAPVQTGDVLADIETSKAAIEVTAPAGGHLRRRQTEGKQVPVGAVLCYLTPGPADPLPEETQARPGGSGAAEGTTFTSKAQALLEEHRLDPQAFAGRGLVRESDVLAMLAGKKAAAPAPDAVGVPTRRSPLPRAKLTEIRYLSGGQNGELVSSVSALCATTGLRDLARRRKDWGGSLSPVVVFEIARLLRKHPIFNAFYDDGSVQFYEKVNVGVVIDAGRGISVPVIRDADKKEASEIVPELQGLLTSYVKDKIDVASVSGGTFTITDLSSEGVFGVMPLVNFRQSAILGLGAEFFLPGAKTGMFQATLAFDHRLTEGRAAAAFLREFLARMKSYEDAAVKGA